jgi:hypothetical protein
MRITRRGVLIGTVALIGIAAGASVLACRPATGGQAALDPERLRVALADIIAPERIGQAYRAGRTHADLEAELAARPRLVVAAAQGCPTTLRDAVRAEVQEEFRRGDVVIADRFVVARSECILAALIA